MDSHSKYNISTEVSYGPLEMIDIRGLHEACEEEWFNQTLCQVNDCVVRLGIIEGEFHWHKHDGEDEFFYVVEGRLLIDLEDQAAELARVSDAIGGRGRAAPGGETAARRGPGMALTAD